MNFIKKTIFSALILSILACNSKNASKSDSKRTDDKLTSKLKPFTDNLHLENGRAIYETKCQACHAEGAKGSVGPNLTDNQYIHGESYENMINVIENGVPEKGMISWKSLLNPIQIQEVASYIKTLQK